MKFQGINFWEMLKNSQFNELEISGENIISLNSHFEGISIPSDGKIASMKITPLPIKRLNVDLFFKGTDVVLSDVISEYFEGYGTAQIRLTHPAILLECDHIGKKINFTFKKFQRLRDLEDVIQLLLTLISGEEPLIIYLKEDKKEVEFLQMSPNENNDIRNELIGMQKILEFLKAIQKHYHIVFRDFELDLSEETIEILRIIKLHMDKNTETLSSFYLSTKDLILNEEVMNYETFTENIINKQQQFGFRVTQKINTINLLNQEIELNEDLIITCNDAYITKSLDPTYLQEENNYRHLEVKSANEGIKMGFFLTEDEIVGF
ncbi:hypothetical protein [Lysinibacillus xylanilyticus]|uniref:hypothetical protein n=1 Tax=Lysinibacillus xylanilyticus TaxID=582475 RepID=UPI00380D3D69